MASRLVLALCHIALAASASIEGLATSGVALGQHRLLLSRLRGTLVHQGKPEPSATPAATTPSSDLDEASTEADKEGSAEAPSVDGGVEHLESVVGDIVLKHEKDAKDGKATPFGPAEKQVRHIIVGTLLPAREQAYKNDELRLHRLVRKFGGCARSKNQQMRVASKHQRGYKLHSKRHKNCRRDESGHLSEKNEVCHELGMEAKRLQRDATCREVQKAQRCKYIDYTVIVEAQNRCREAKSDVKKAERICARTKRRYESTVNKCNAWQSRMDEKACKHAVFVRDTCQHYKSCYGSQIKSYKFVERNVRKDEKARGGEWRALKRMECLLDTFANGKVTDKEIDDCKRKRHYPPTINYPDIPGEHRCVIPTVYPSTAAYKHKEFARLPHDAKGQPEQGSCYAMGL